MIQIKFNNADSVQLATVGSPKAIVYTLGSGSSPVFTCSDNFFSKNDENYYCFAITGENVQLSGVIDSVTTKQQFMNLFKGQTAITNASELQLTASSMTEGCYANMFLDCTNLTTPPSTLPATNLDMWCYSSMFGNCSALTAVPTLPATNLAKYCYYAMFYGCKNIVEAPYLPANTLTDWCYNSMFYNCTELTSISCDFTSWTPSNATNDWVKGVKENGNFNKLILLHKEFGDSRIPTNWTIEGDSGTEPLTFTGKDTTNAVQLIKTGTFDDATLYYSKNNGNWLTYNIGDIIELDNEETVAFYGPNETFSLDPYVSTAKYFNFVMTGVIESSGNVMSLMNYKKNCTNNCFYGLFNSCSSLISAPLLPATGLAQKCYDSMFLECTSLSTAPVLSATTLAQNCYRTMFYGCTSLTSTPELPASTLMNGCYVGMFLGCTSLKTFPLLPATKATERCYQQMFQDCTGLTGAVTLPATGYLKNSCYHTMFSGCTNITSAYISGLTLNDYAASLMIDCFRNMFKGCSKLKYVNVNFTDWGTDIMSQDPRQMFTDNWLSGVYSGGKFVKPSALNWNTGVSFIPNGWSITNK